MAGIESDLDRSVPDIIYSFTGTLRRLMTELAREFPNDRIVSQAKQRLALAADALPVTIIEIAGPYLYRHRAAIYDPDPAVWQKFFEPGAFEADLATAEDESKKDMAVYLIPKIQELASKKEIAQQFDYIEVVRDLLDDFIEWQLAARAP